MGFPVVIHTTQRKTDQVCILNMELKILLLVSFIFYTHIRYFFFKFVLDLFLHSKEANVVMSSIVHLHGIFLSC